jgi:hypothetical protein
MTLSMTARGAVNFLSKKKTVLEAVPQEMCGRLPRRFPKKCRFPKEMQRRFPKKCTGSPRNV